MIKAKQKLLLVGQLGKLAGVRPDTVRYYERCGLLPRADRSAAGYRVYGNAAVQQLRFVRKAQALGFSLDEIRRIVSLRGRGKETCRCVINMAEATLAETETKLKELQNFRDGLIRHLTEWKHDSKRKPVSEFCALIESAAE